MNDPFRHDTANAFCRHTHATATGAPTGPLAGLTFAAKDIYDIAGARTGFGSPAWLAEHPPATKTAWAVQRLLDAGATLVGKTHTDEMTYSLTGENAHYGTPLNVRAPGRIPGGSSSGSAAATAAGLVDFALGSDTGGSIRGPASFCGVFGLRPTHGRIPLEGARPLAPSFDACGWFADRPDILGRVGQVLLDRPAVARRPRRLLLAEDAFALADPAVQEALAGPVRQLAALADSLTPMTLAPEGLATWTEHFRLLQAREIWQTYGSWLERVQPTLGPGVRERFAWASTITEEVVAPLRQWREGEVFAM